MPCAIPRAGFSSVGAPTASPRQAEWPRQKTKQSTEMAAWESGNSNSENARTTVQRARAKPSARQVEPIKACPPAGKSIRRPTLESRVGQSPLSAEPPQGSQSAPTTVCDESRAPSAATFRFAGPPSALATPTGETSMTIRQPEHHPPAFPIATVDAQKSIAPEN